MTKSATTPAEVTIATNECGATALAGELLVGELTWVSERPGYAELDLLEVHPGWRRRGIATQLWEAVAAAVPLSPGSLRTGAGDAWAHSVLGGELPELDAVGDFELCSPNGWPAAEVDEA